MGFDIAKMLDEDSVAVGCSCPDCTAKRATQLAQTKDGVSAREQELRVELKEYLSDVDPGVAWDDVVGNEAAREALTSAIVSPHTQKDIYAHYGVRPARGAALYGPPGCGKTMLAKAVAGALAKLHADRTPLIRVNGSQIQQGYVGQTEAIIRNIFEFSRLYSKRTGRQVVIFVDEAGAILPARDGRRTYGYESSNVSTFLTEMDGIEGETGAFVLLATNRLQAIDSAVLRDGRCDHVIKVVRPDVHAARCILQRAFASVPSGGYTSEQLAAHAAQQFFSAEHRLSCEIQYGDGGTVHGSEHLTLGHVCSGAMMVGLVERAKKCAIRRDLAADQMTGVTLQDVDEAVQQMLAENSRIHHSYAVDEVIERLGETARLRESLKTPEHHGKSKKTALN